MTLLFIVFEDLWFLTDITLHCLYSLPPTPTPTPNRFLSAFQSFSSINRAFKKKIRADELAFKFSGYWECDNKRAQVLCGVECSCLCYVFYSKNLTHDPSSLCLPVSVLQVSFIRVRVFASCRRTEISTDLPVRGKTLLPFHLSLLSTSHSPVLTFILFRFVKKTKTTSNLENCDINELTSHCSLNSCGPLLPVY